MEQILNSRTEGIDYTRYATYLGTVRDKLPAHVYAFAADFRHFDLASPSSLHDAWLETLLVREASSGQRHEIRKLEISLRLLGQMHDRWIHLHYTGVIRYLFDYPPRHEEKAHGDIFTHEIRPGEKGHFIHEILFEHNTILLIECADMRHSEERIERPSA